MNLPGENTTVASPPHVTTAVPMVTPAYQSLGWRELFWTPYVALTAVLMALAFVSFYLYHRRNRDKYRNAAIKIKNNFYAKPRKYRVTLNRNGYVGCIAHTQAGNSTIPRDDEITKNFHNDNSLPEVFALSEISPRNADTHTQSTSGYDITSREDDSTEARNYNCYDNEACDVDSNPGSDKSLIGRTTRFHEATMSLPVVEHDESPRKPWFEKYRVKPSNAKKQTDDSTNKTVPDNAGDNFSNNFAQTVKSHGMASGDVTDGGTRGVGRKEKRRKRRSRTFEDSRLSHVSDHVTTTRNDNIADGGRSYDMENPAAI